MAGPVTVRRPIRLLLVDDSPAVARQVAQVLSPAFEIVAVLPNGEELLGTLAACEPDVVLLDITMPGQNGIVLAAQLTQSGRHSKIVFLTIHDDIDYVRSTFSAGALGYVVKNRLALDLEAALLAAVDGERFVSPALRLDPL